jgi:hypothetical protein
MQEDQKLPHKHIGASKNPDRRDPNNHSGDQTHDNIITIAFSKDQNATITFIFKKPLFLLLDILIKCESE